MIIQSMLTAVVISCKLRENPATTIYLTQFFSRSQVFIKLHRSGFVGWNVHRIDKGVFDSSNLAIREGRTGFHEIIGYNYHISSQVSRPTVVNSLPLARGTFHDERFRRIILYQIDDRRRYQLPYNPEDPQEGDWAYTPPLLWSEWIWQGMYNSYER